VADDGTPRGSEEPLPSEPGDNAGGRRRRRGLWIAIGLLALAVVAAAGATIGVSVGRGSGSTPDATSLPAAAAGPPPSAAPTTTSSTVPPGPPCPLSGVPAPGGAVPSRPALAIKVDNYPSARPQSGLNNADVVFEVPVEGGITRLVAVFQCQDAQTVGDVRSARATDALVLDELSRPLFVHVGGIAPVLSLIRQANLIDLDLGTRASLIQHPPGRYAPYNTFVSTAAVWEASPDDAQPPAPIFTYSATPPTAQAVTSVHIPYSSTNDATWTWDPNGQQWVLAYGAAPAMLADGQRIRAANIVVEVAQVTYGPWLEDSRHGLEVQSQLVGSGPLIVFRNGTEVGGTWQRPSAAEPASLIGTDGTPIALAPGETWVEIVPASIPVTSTVAAPIASPASAPSA
jgi:Protein of unknown function (DUF3048) N-terminal domain/Protein of unknown function (DUF3048) C-terminal domain